MAAVSKRVARAQIAAPVWPAGMRSALRDAAWEEGRSSGRTGLKRPRGMSSDSTGTVRSVRIHKVRGTFPTNLTHTPPNRSSCPVPTIYAKLVRRPVHHRNAVPFVICSAGFLLTVSRYTGIPAATVASAIKEGPGRLRSATPQIHAIAAR